VVRFTPRPLYSLAKIFCYPFDRRLGGTRRPSGRCGEGKNCSSCRKWNPSRPARSL